MQECRLVANDLACRRGDRILFRGLTLDLGPGAALHVAGANGVGKSSLIRILCGLASPFAGSVERVGDAGLIDERPALDPHLPLGQALAFWSGFDRLGKPMRKSIIDRLGLDRLLEVPVRYLSTGQKKRAALARLLGQRVPIWFLDEPLNGLDREAADIVQTLAADHCAQGGISVVASHQAFALPEMVRFDLAVLAA